MVTPAQSYGEFIDFLRSNIAKVVALIIAYVVMLSVIGFQNVPFIDDSHRRLTGNTDFGPWDGRWGSELVAIVLNQGRTVVDLGLTTFILTGIILAFASCLVVYALAGYRANWFTFAMALTLGLNPWYLNAAAFRFDGPLIALSVLFAAATILFARARKLPMFLAYLLLAWVVTNFFQPMLGLALILLLTFLVLNWLRGVYPTREALVRLGVGLGAVAGGALLYLLQTLIIVPGRVGAQVITFDFSNLPGALRQNTVALARQFWHDNTPIWLGIYVLVTALFVVAVVQLSRRGLGLTLLAFGLYAVLVVLAAGNVLLLATTPHITTNARFMAPLAMVITLIAIVVSVTEYPTPLRQVARLVLVALAYVWLSLTFVFSMVLREQQDALRFQVAAITPALMSEFQPGDTLVYDPRVFANSLYFNRAAQRFPIFQNNFYSDVIFPGEGSIRFRIAELLGLNIGYTQRLEDPIVRSGLATQGFIICNDGKDGAYPVITGPHWQIFRGDGQTVCLTLVENIITSYWGEDGSLTLEFDLDTFPFGPGAGPEMATFKPADLEMAIWSVQNAGDIQWVTGLDLDNGVVRFWVPAPFEHGWTGSYVAAHFFLNGRFVYQYLWQINY